MTIRFMLMMVLMFGSAPLLAMNELDPNLRQKGLLTETEGRAVECQTCAVTWASPVDRYAENGAVMPKEDTQKTVQQNVDGEKVTIDECRKAAGFDEHGSWSATIKVAENAQSVCESALKNYPSSAAVKAYLGRAYYLANRNQESFALIKAAAAQDNLSGLGLMGVAYEYGYGIEKDNAKATLWYRKAADRGLATAQNNLGLLYVNGKGVPVDYAEALVLFTKAAKQGHAEAQSHLGSLYFNGQGVEQDYVLAARWFRKSAEQGYALAQRNMGVMYADARGVDRNDAEADKWLKLAAAQGNADAIHQLETRKKRAEEFASKLKNVQKIDAKSDDEYEVGMMYKFGYGTTPDYAQALKWFSRAAESSHPGAMEEIRKITHKLEALEKIIGSATRGDAEAVSVVRKYAMGEMQEGTKFRDCQGCPLMTQLVPLEDEGVGCNDQLGVSKPIVYTDPAGKKMTNHIMAVGNFAFGKLEVNRGQWQAVAGDHAPITDKKCDTDDCPVDHLSLQETEEFIGKLNTKTGEHYRLADESECAYVCSTKENRKYCGNDTQRTAHLTGDKQPGACGGLGIRIIRMTE